MSAIRKVLVASGVSIALLAVGVVPASANTAPPTRPPNPTHLTVSSSRSGTVLRWSASGNNAARVAVATNSAMTSGRHDYMLESNTAVFSPPGLVKGHTYYFDVASYNMNYKGKVGSTHWTNKARATVADTTTGIRVMTFNILHSYLNSKNQYGVTPASWKTRAPAAAAIIRQYNPAVVSLQESNGEGTTAHTTQAQDLDTRLGAYVRSPADPVLCPVYCHVGKLSGGPAILYQPAKLKPFGGTAGYGHWNLGSGSDNPASVYQAFTVAGGGRVLVISSHLTPGAGHSLSLRREAEAKKLISYAASKARALGGASIVYSGDYNSNPTSDPDGPAIEMRAVGNVNARYVAVTHTNEKYYSMNHYTRAAPYTNYGNNITIDHIYLTPGVSVTNWGVAMNLSKGKWVGIIPSDHDPVWADVQVPTN